MVRRGDVGRRPESPLRTKGEISQMNIGEIQLGLPGGVKLQPHLFVREGLAHMIRFPLMGQETAGGNLFDLIVRRIDQRFVALIQPSDTGLATCKLKRFMTASSYPMSF